jgi:carboxypeptidase Q
MPSVACRFHVVLGAGLLLAFLSNVVTAQGGGAAPPGAPTSLADQYRDAAQRLIGAALTSDQAYTRLSALCDGIGNRLSGSESLERAIDWAVTTMRADGLEGVRTLPATAPHWVRGQESAELLEPVHQKLFMLGLGRSIGTPSQGITADVVVVGSFDELAALPESDVRGKIVLYDVPFTNYRDTVKYRGDGANRAAQRGAVAVLVRSVGPVSLRTPHTGNMSAYVDSIPKIPAAAVTLEDATLMHRLASRGEKLRVRLKMEARMLPDVRSANVIGEIRGREKPDEVVVVGGHIDSWDVGQGAQDDGGGIIVSWEAVRLMKQLGLRPRRTIRVVLWTNEENGTGGAKAYRDSLGDKVGSHVAAIESDGGVERPVGFGVNLSIAKGDSVGLLRQQRATARVHDIASLLAGLGADTITEEGGGADIGPLMKAGVPGLAHHTIGEHYFDWHHTNADTMDKIDPLELRKNVAAMAVMAYVLADMPGRLGD